MSDQQWLFLAPRSNEKSRENFLATLATGYPVEEIEEFLTPGEKKVLGARRKLYIWGNQRGKEGSWNKMKDGDLIAFYAKGEFVYVGKCILKKRSKEIGSKLWGNVPKKDYTWEFVFFLDQLRPISIPLNVIRKLGGYQEKMVVMGFMPMNEIGVKNIISTYGSLVSFFDNYSQGLNSKEAAILDDISEKTDLKPEEVVEVDEATRSKDLDLLLADWEQRKNDQTPNEIERMVKSIRRNITLVRQMKERRKNECQVCGFTFRQRNGNLYSEVAHIKPISSKKAGVDAPSNMIVLCPNHHKMLDLGSLKIISNTSYIIGEEQAELRESLFDG